MTVHWAIAATFPITWLIDVHLLLRHVSSAIELHTFYFQFSLHGKLSLNLCQLSPALRGVLIIFLQPSKTMFCAFKNCQSPSSLCPVYSTIARQQLPQSVNLPLPPPSQAESESNQEALQHLELLMRPV
jgi:hypothetical protein